jgi:hypothetical protein
LLQALHRQIEPTSAQPLHRCTVISTPEGVLEVASRNLAASFQVSECNRLVEVGINPIQKRLQPASRRHSREGWGAFATLGFHQLRKQKENGHADQDVIQSQHLGGACGCCTELIKAVHKRIEALHQRTSDWICIEQLFRLSKYR